MAKVNPIGLPVGNPPTVDRTQPLARGLVGCWVPGYSFTDLARVGAPINLKYGTTPTGFGSTKEGPGVTHTGNGSGLITDSLPSGSPLLFTSQLSVYCRVQQLSQSSANADFWALIYDNTAASPFYIAGVRNQSGLYGSSWNTGGTFTSSQIGTVSCLTSGFFSIASTFVVGGNVTFYFNGLSKGTIAFGASAPTPTATSFLNIGEYKLAAGRFANTATLILYVWNRALSAAEVLALDLNPYGLLARPQPSLGWIPKQRVNPITPPPNNAVVIALNLLGVR